MAFDDVIESKESGYRVGPDYKIQPKEEVATNTSLILLATFWETAQNKPSFVFVA